MSRLNPFLYFGRINAVIESTLRNPLFIKGVVA